MSQLLKILRRSLFIQSQDTPNPNFLKFLPQGKILMEQGTFDFTTKKSSIQSPLAFKLFSIPGVTRVFYGQNYISIGKEDDVNWDELKPLLYEEIEMFYNLEQPLFKNAPEKTIESENDSDVVLLIKEILESRIRPFLQEDGGDVAFKKFEEKHGILILELQGACTGCPSSEMTLKGGIERMIKHYVAEVKAVHAFDKDSDEIEVVEQLVNNCQSNKSKIQVVLFFLYFFQLQSF